MIEQAAHLIWNVIAVFSVSFTATIGIVRLNGWLDDRRDRRRQHARPKRRWER